MERATTSSPNSLSTTPHRRGASWLKSSHAVDQVVASSRYRASSRVQAVLGRHSTALPTLTTTGGRTGQRAVGRTAHQRAEPSHSRCHLRMLPNGCLDPRLERRVHGVETSQCVVIQTTCKEWHQHPCEALLLHDRTRP